MMKCTQSLRIAIAVSAVVMISACQTIRMPKIDILKSPEFSEDAANIRGDYPSVKDAPLEPTDIRSGKQWDRDARQLQALRDVGKRIEMEPGPSESEGETEFKKLKAKAQAYKKDDPSTGPTQGFPKYKPRR